MKTQRNRKTNKFKTKKKKKKGRDVLVMRRLEARTITCDKGTLCEHEKDRKLNSAQT